MNLIIINLEMHQNFSLDFFFFVKSERSDHHPDSDFSFDEFKNRDVLFADYTLQIIHLSINMRDREKEINVAS